MSSQVGFTDDSILQQSSDYNSFSNMSPPEMNQFSDVLGLSDDGKATPSNLLSDFKAENDTSFAIEMLPPLDSFVTIIEQLSGLTVENNQYFVDGPLAMADLEQLDVYTRRIRELTLSDTKSTVHPEVAPETLVRLAMIQNTPFLSSLECLRVIDVDQALSYLFFCIAPSLRTLEVAGIPSNRQITISAFLKQVVIEVPQLSTIILRRGLPTSALQSALQFNHLRQLHIIDAAENLEYSFLQSVSALPELEVLVISASTAKYSEKGFSGASAEHPADGRIIDSLSADVVSESASTSTIPFRQLQTLAITGSVLLMGDLIRHLPPCAVKGISLALVQHRLPDISPASTPRDEEIVNGAQEPMYTMSIQELEWICNQFLLQKIHQSRNARHVITTKTGGSLLLTTSEVRKYQKHLAVRRQKQVMEDNERKTFFDMIEQIFTFASPNSISIDCLNTFQTQFNNGEVSKLPSELPVTTFEKLLSVSYLEELNFGHWEFPALPPAEFPIGGSIAPLRSMRNMRLPLNPRSGVVIWGLQHILRRYPHLTKLECFIEFPPSVAFDFDDDVGPYELEVLSVGGALPPGPKDKVAIATYLALLFPHLKAIETPNGHTEDWQYIYSLVKMCQTVSLAVEKRDKASFNAAHSMSNSIAP